MGADSKDRDKIRAPEASEAMHDPSTQLESNKIGSTPPPSAVTAHAGSHENNAGAGGCKPILEQTEINHVPRTHQSRSQRRWRWQELQESARLWPGDDVPTRALDSL
jgi:hypothetical protein